MPSFMRRHPWLIALGILLVCIFALVSFGQHARADVTSGSTGSWVTYANSPGDTWFNTWADDGNIYATSNDTAGFNNTCNSDLAINELSGDDPNTLTAPFVNCMTSYGLQGDYTQYPDGHSWKTGGILSLDGVLYLVVARQTGAGTNAYPTGLQVSENASIVKSSDHGRTWTNSFGTVNDPNGAAPPYDNSAGRVAAMFPGQRFAVPFFITYGQDDNVASTADGGDRYVYAVSNDGYAYNGNQLYLGRVRRDQIGDLNVGEWQFYTGQPGGDGANDANWSSDLAQAQSILSAPNDISQPEITYIPALHRYIMASFTYATADGAWPYNGETAHTIWDFYQSATPWGSWSKFSSQDTTPYGWYDPTFVAKFSAMQGLSQTIFTSGDFTNPSGQINGDILYRLHVLPFSLTSDTLAAVDDSDPAISYSGHWASGGGSGSGYFGNTAHYSNTPGDAVSYTFTGTSIEWVGASNTNHGQAFVQIDQQSPILVDTYSPQWQKQAILFARNNLGSGQHTITITLTANQNAAASGTFQDIDAFITSAATPSVAGAVDDAMGQYTGDWIDVNPAANYFAMTAHYTPTVGNTATYSFTGTRIAWIGASNTNHGQALVQIDQQSPILVDTYSPQWGTQTVLFERTALAAGSHTLTITVTGQQNAASGGTFQDVDAFDYGS